MLMPLFAALMPSLPRRLMPMRDAQEAMLRAPRRRRRFSIDADVLLPSRLIAAAVRCRQRYRCVDVSVCAQSRFCPPPDALYACLLGTAACEVSRLLL